MRALLIGPDERDKIATLVEAARAEPRLSVEDMTSMSSDHLTISLPFGYTVTFTFEQQPIGLCRHISISIDRKGFAPSLEALKMICEEFGFTGSFDGWHVFKEDLPDGWIAMNIIQPVEAA